MLNLKTFIKHSSGYHLQNAILTQDLILSILKKDRISFAEYIIGRGGNSFNFGKIWVWIYVSVNLIQLTVAKKLSICWLYQFLWNYCIFSLDQSFFEWNVDEILRKGTSNIQISNHKLLLLHLPLFFSISFIAICFCNQIYKLKMKMPSPLKSQKMKNHNIVKTKTNWNKF